MKAVKKIWDLYYDGFSNMTLGRSLWLIVIVKLAVMFLILRLFFFQPALSSYGSDAEKSRVVIENLTD